jgi:hypothetical protein
MEMKVRIHSKADSEEESGYECMLLCTTVRYLFEFSVCIELNCIFSSVIKCTSLSLLLLLLLYVHVRVRTCCVVVRVLPQPVVAAQTMDVP